MDVTKHNYYRRLMDALANRPDIRAAGVHNIDIRHDSWCAIYKGGYCNCDPDIDLRQIRSREKRQTQ